MLAATALSTLIGYPAFAATSLPSGGVVKSGSATFSNPSASSLQITQTSAKAIIDWGQFSIGTEGKVQFNNKSGATLNVVTGTDVSSIDGLLSATGSVYLINPNGVIIGSGGVVDVGGTFVASTLPVSNSAFTKGANMTFAGASTAKVLNLGKIGALGGDIVLIANTVNNTGSLTAAKGDVGLLAGSRVLVQDLASNGGKFVIQLAASGASAANTGAITAAMVELRANGGNVYALAGNTAGVIDATGVSATDGKVFLVATGGDVTAQGQITATAADGSGGAVQTIGRMVNFKGVTLDAGTWLIEQDSLNLTSSMTPTLSRTLATTNITLQTTGASGTGDIQTGGVLAWSSGKTLTLDAFGDITVGAEVAVDGGALVLSAPAGAITFNSNVKVSGSGAVTLATNGTAIDPNLNFGLTSAGFAGSLSFDGTAKSGQALTIDGQAYSLLYALAQKGSTGPDHGTDDIAGIDHAGDGGYYALAGNLTGSGTATSAQFTAALVGEDVAGGAENNPFTGVFEGLGHTIANLTISDATGADTGLFGTNQGTIRDVGVASGSIIGANIVGGLVGTDEASTITNLFSRASVSGRDAEIGGGLIGYISSPGATSISNAFASGSVSVEVAGGLVGVISSNAGSKVSITNTYATGEASGLWVGGLIGEIDNNGGAGPVSIVKDYATGTVSGFYVAGGLIGSSTGATISTSFATGAVSSVQLSGGLIGANFDGAVSDAYATGAVTLENGSGFVGIGTGYAGGLIGLNQAGDVPIISSFGVESSPGSGLQAAAPITDTFATGAVSGVGRLAGLVGANNGIITYSYWDKTTSGQAADGFDLGGSDATQGLTTASLQHGGAKFSDQAFALGTNGAYPYLKALPPAQ